MALRKLASEMTMRMGMSIAPASQAPTSMMGAWSRAYAKVMDNLKYAQSHEWVSVDGDVATIGISDFAQGELGDVVYVELPSEGETFDAGQAFGVVESVKTASDVYAPVSGEVIASNSAASDDPKKVNDGPYDDGWLIKIKMSNASEVESLLDSAAYTSQISK